MLQQINLLNTLSKSPRYYLTDRLLFQILGGFILVLIIVSVLQALFLHHAEKKFGVLQQSYHDSQLAFTKQSALAGNVDINSIQHQLQEKTALLQTLQARKITSGECALLSHYFISLGEMAVSGLWFTEMTIDLSKNDIVLNGQTYDPTLVMSLVENLNQTACFAGRNFGALRLSKPTTPTPQQNVLDFTLDSPSVKNGKVN